jgi:phosphatidylglycerol:prolipoprotein diacylglycerol transferase
VKPIINLGSLELSTYVVMISLAASLGLWLTYREAARKGLDAVRLLTLAAIAFGAGLLGARGLNVLASEPVGAASWSSVPTLWDHVGMSFYGGLVFAAAAGLVYARAARLPSWEVADVLAVSFSPAVALARMGCFLNGCCYGRPTAGPFGLVAGGAPNLVNFGIPSHPTQLYEAAFALALFGWLWHQRSRRRFVGQLAVAFLAAYPLFRFFQEFLRGDPRPAWEFGSFMVLSFNQIVSLAVMGFALLASAVLERRRETLPLSSPKPRDDR